MTISSWKFSSWWTILSILGKIDVIEKDYSHCIQSVKAHSIMLQTVQFYM